MGPHDSSLEGFYVVARSVLMPSEARLDDFDLAFALCFKGVAVDAKVIAEELLDRLRDPVKLRALSDGEKALGEKLDLDGTIDATA